MYTIRCVHSTLPWQPIRNPRETIKKGVADLTDSVRVELLAVLLRSRYVPSGVLRDDNRLSATWRLMLGWYHLHSNIDN